MADLDEHFAAREDARLHLARLRATDRASLDRALASVLRVALETLDVSRVGLWFFDADAARSNHGPPSSREGTYSLLRCTYILDRTDPDAAAGTTFPIPDFQAYADELVSKRVIALSDVRGSVLQGFVPPYFNVLDVRATLDAPIYREGRVVGVVCSEHRGSPRDWTERERSFAISIADIVTQLLMSSALAEANDNLRAAEQRLFRELTTEALGRVSRGVAHDINNMLGVIVTTTDVMARGRTPEQLAADIAAIKSVATAGARLAKRLMTFGRREQGTLRQVVLDDALKDAHRLLLSVAGDKRTLVIRLGAKGAKTFIDPAFLEQVFLNLVTNAREATTDGGEIILSTRITELNDATGAWAEFIALDVRDTGRGMDEKTRAACFEPFFTTKPDARSSGFGLATVAGIVSAIGGVAKVESELGKGSTFTIGFPLVVTPTAR